MNCDAVDATEQESKIERGARERETRRHKHTHIWNTFTQTTLRNPTNEFLSRIILNMSIVSGVWPLFCWFFFNDFVFNPDTEDTGREHNTHTHLITTVYTLNTYYMNDYLYRVTLHHIWANINSLKLRMHHITTHNTSNTHKTHSIYYWNIYIYVHIYMNSLCMYNICVPIKNAVLGGLLFILIQMLMGKCVHFGVINFLQYWFTSTSQIHPHFGRPRWVPPSLNRVI